MLENCFEVMSPLPNPEAATWAYCAGVFLKVVGVLGAVGLVSGSTWLWFRRVFRKGQVGVSNFADWAFLGVLGAAGLSGTLAYVVRLSGCAAVAYPVFFVHLSLVAYLLSTLAYTKFAHVFYRTSAMTYAIHIGRSADSGDF